MADERISTGQFNQRAPREAFVWGSDQFVADMHKVFEALTFVRVINAKMFKTARSEAYFVIGQADFRKTAMLQELVREFEKHNAINAYKVIYETNLATLPQRERFFAAEVGASTIVAGKERDSDLRAFVKKISFQAEQLGSITYYENEITSLSRRMDQQGLKAIDDKLSHMDKDAEDVLRLRAMIASVSGKTKVFEGGLKRILQLNPQNLWAANELGKHYLRTNRAAEGIELLAKLSAFSELNGERLLTLGDAYLNAGKIDKAGAVLKAGLALNSNNDSRFETAIAKAQVASGDLSGALVTLKDVNLPESVLSYLNTRAILAIKTKNFAQGFQFYEHAVSRGVDDPAMKAKLHYNYGLGYIRANEIEKAIKHFEQSVQLGGAKFQRAKGPLEIANKILKTNQKKRSAEETLEVNNIEFEEFVNEVRDPNSPFDIKSEAS